MIDVESKEYRDANRPDTKRPSEAVVEAFKTIIETYGGDLNSEGMKDTPVRATLMFQELLEGMLYTNEEIIAEYNKCFEHTDVRDLVIVQDIPVFSMCEHHLALMYNMKVHVAYIPNNRVIGISKIARIAQLVAKRFQLQERIGKDIANILRAVLLSDDVMVVVEGEHACMSARGARAIGSRTKTSTISGRFWDVISLREEALALMRG